MWIIIWLIILQRKKIESWKFILMIVSWQNILTFYLKWFKAFQTEFCVIFNMTYLQILFFLMRLYYFLHFNSILVGKSKLLDFFYSKNAEGFPSRDCDTLLLETTLYNTTIFKGFLFWYLFISIIITTILFISSLHFTF